ncbi:MAG: DUF2867 domain-containing protein [Burkholderiales bacterium]
MRKASATVAECEFPALSALERHLVDTAYFRDSYRATMSRKGASVIEVFHAIFAHHPTWIKVALVIRNRMASLCGLETPTASEIMSPTFKNSYSVGEKIGPWPIFALTPSELVAGRDNKHLDFRLSVLRLTEGSAASVVVSTVCVVHNAFGKVYLFFVVPFHKWGVRSLISRAVTAGRL